MSFEAVAIYKYLHENVGHIFSLIKKFSSEKISEDEKKLKILYSNKIENFNIGQIFIVTVDDNPKLEKRDQFPYIIKEVDKDKEFFEIINIDKDISEKIELFLKEDKQTKLKFFLKNNSEDTFSGIFYFENNLAIVENINDGIYIDSYNYSNVKESNNYIKFDDKEYFCPKNLNSKVIKLKYIIHIEEFLNRILVKSEPNNKKRSELISILKNEIEAYSNIDNKLYSQKLESIMKKLKFNQNYFHYVLEKYFEDYLEKNNLIKSLNLDINKKSIEVKSLSREINEKLERRIYLENKNEELESKNLELKNISETLHNKGIKISELDESIKNKLEILEKYELELDKLNKIFYKYQYFKAKKFKLEKRFFYFKEINLLPSFKESLKDYKDGFFVINADASWLTPDLFWKARGFLNNFSENPISIKGLFNLAEENKDNLIQLVILGANRAPIEGYFYQVIKAIEANLPLVYEDDIFIIPNNIVFFFQIDDDIYSAKLSDGLKKYIREINQDNINELITQENI